MKKYSEKKEQNQTLIKTRLIAQKNELPHANWTPIVAIVLTGLAAYIAYALCSNISVVDYCSTGSWQFFG